MSDNPFEAVDGDSVDGGNDPVQSATSWAGKLFDGDADGPPVAELEADYDLPREVCIVLRGILRTAQGGGVPPIAEIVLGIVIYVISGQQNDAGESVSIDQLSDRVND
jgi:hypothetical protein